MRCSGLLIAILIIVLVLVVFKTMTLIVKYRRNILLWWKRYAIWKFIVNVFLPFAIPFVITIVVTISGGDNYKPFEPLFLFLCAMCVFAIVNLCFQLRFWIKEHKERKLEWKYQASHHAYYSLYDVIKEKNIQYGIKSIEMKNGYIPEKMIPYNVFDQIRRICSAFRHAVAHITGIDTVHITVSFIYHYTYEDTTKDDYSWRWIMGKDSGFDISLKDFTKRDESMYHYLINNNSAMAFYNDKNDAAEDCKYYFSYKDRLHNNEGSLFASKVSFANNLGTCCEGILMITTYGQKFVESNSEHTPDEFKKLLLDEIFPCYKNLLKIELGMLYFRHKTDRYQYSMKRLKEAVINKAKKYDEA